MDKDNAFIYSLFIACGIIVLMIVLFLYGVNREMTELKNSPQFQSAISHTDSSNKMVTGIGLDPVSGQMKFGTGTEPGGTTIIIQPIGGSK